MAAGVAPHQAAALSDDELRRTLVRLHLAQRRQPLSAACERTLRSLGMREQAMRAQAMRAQAHLGEDAHDLQALQDLLSERYGIRVAEDGLVEAPRITQDVACLVGADLHVALYHHTSDALVPLIARQGLRVGRQTNFFNTQQGVYLSTIAAGRPVDMYSARAAKVHGGWPCTLRVRRLLGQILPDPDDHDLAWAQGRQFVTPEVQVSDICWDEPAEQAVEHPRLRMGMGMT